MTRLLKVTVTRTSSTDLYIEVPDDFPVVEILQNKYQTELERIALETTDRSDWDEYEWEKTVEAQEVAVADPCDVDQFMQGTLRISPK